ncbi:MAG: thiamine-phosphate kinase [Fimbriimonadales bacterium]
MRELSGEEARIEWIRARMGHLVPPASVQILQGIGDDTAVVRLGERLLLLTVDMLVEGIHFRLDWIDAYHLGWKALAVNLSDIGSMGGQPALALLSLAMPERLSEGAESEVWLSAFAEGFRDCAQAYQTALIGGDTNRSDKVVVDVMVMGTVEGEPVLRSGARVGDWILVTGALGGSRAGLMRLTRGERHDTEALEAHFKPVPRVWEGQILRREGVHAMMDVSDGLAADLPKLLRASGVGAVVYPHRVPVHPAASRYAETVGEEPARFALKGGEDYELLVCADPQTAQRLIQQLPAETGTPLTWIGVVEAGDALWLEDGAGNRTPFDLQGWSHF